MLSPALCGGTHRPESQGRWPRWRCSFQQVCVDNIRQHFKFGLNEITYEKDLISLSGKYLSVVSNLLVL